MTKGYIIQYDISNNKQRNDTYKLLKKNAFHLQGSVFFMPKNAMPFKELQKQLKVINKEKSADIRCYKIDYPILLFGQNPLISDCYFSGFPQHHHFNSETLTTENHPLWQTQTRGNVCIG